MGQALAEAVVAGIATAFLIGILLVSKAIKKGIDKVKDFHQLKSYEILKIDHVFQKIGMTIFPLEGK